jgi:hypothetical protein
LWCPLRSTPVEGHALLYDVVHCGTCLLQTRLIVRSV